MAAGDNKTTIIVAVIGLLSALGVAVITNYDKLFPKQTMIPAPTATIRPSPTESDKTLRPKPKTTEITYKKMDFGYNGCDVHFGKLMKGVSEADMIRLATTEGAEGFTFQPELKYGEIMVGHYPKECKSSPDMSWPLYLKVD